MKNYSFFLISLLVFCFACSDTEGQPSTTTSSEQQKESSKTSTTTKTKSNKKLIPGHGYEFENNGKDREAPAFSDRYEKVNINTMSDLSLRFSADLSEAIQQSKVYLGRKKNRTHVIGRNFTVSNYQLKNTATIVQNWVNNPNGKGLGDVVDAYQLNGEDNHGNVHFTGYFVPVIKVSDKKDAIYKYAIYRKPKSWPQGRKLTRKEIDGDGLLAGRGYELAYADNLLDVYFMHVQGSGVVEYPDGTRKLLSYGGKNGFGYKSAGRYLVDNGEIAPEEVSLSAVTNWLNTHPERLEEVLYHNKSYTFFSPGNVKVRGAANVPLTAKTSVAVDPKIIPLGSTLLAKVPVLNDEGELVRHEYRILVAQDTGGAIKQGHVDFYSGIGPEGKRVANALHHYGKVWILKAK